MKPLRKINREMLIVAVAALVALLFSAIPAFAQIKGACADCHTMHNSQDGLKVAGSWDAGTSTFKADGPYERLLLRDGCLGCHTGTYTPGTDQLKATPKVMGYSDPGSTTIKDTPASGSFWWVGLDSALNDAKGHNVKSIVLGADENFTATDPPGWDDTTGPADVKRGDFDPSAAATQLSCAGKFGCHGDPLIPGNYASLSGAHHGVANINAPVVAGINGFCDGTTISKSFRFLDGIVGIEDDDWEYSVAFNDHNQYHGVHRTAATIVDKTTISHFCCECHGDFHDIGSTTWGSPWLRHPTDYDMNAVTAGATEYSFYNFEVGTNPGDYSTLAPVGSDLTGVDPTSVSGEVISNVFTAGKAIVTCISCHRAHGSEFDDLLRWDYSSASTDYHAASGVGTDSGCFVCHTTKDNK